MGFNIPKFSLPKISLPNISLPKFQAPKINLPNPQQVFGMFKGSNAPKPQTKVSAPKPNLLQRAANFGQSFVKNPIAATQRLQQKVTNKVVNSAKYVGSGTVNNAKRLANHTGKQFTRFENWADKGIKSNNKWSQQNRNSSNLLNKVTANANLGFTKVAKETNNAINTSSTYYRGLRKSNNILVKGAGYAGGLATSIGRGLASPVTFADPRLTGKQRSSQVGDGLMSYIPVGKVLGLGGKAVKTVGGPILKFGGKIVKPIGAQISQRAPWLVKGGAKVVAGSKNIAGNIAASKGSQLVKNKLVTPFVNRVIKPTTKGLNNINNTLNRKITFKDVKNLPQTIGNKLGLGKGVKPAANGNQLRNISVGTRQRLANSGKLPLTARANAKRGVNNVTNQVVAGNNRATINLPKQFQGTADELLKRHGAKRTLTPAQQKAANNVNLQMNLNRSGGQQFTAKAERQAAKLEKSYGKNLENIPADKIRINDVASKGRRARLVGSTPQLFDKNGNRTEMAKEILKIMKNETNKYGRPMVITGAEAQKAGIRPVWNGSSGTIKGNDRLVWQDAYTAKNGAVVREGYVPFRKGQKFDNGHLESAAEIWNKNAHRGGTNNSTIQRKMNDPANYRVENATQNRSKGSDGIEYDNITVVSPLRTPLR
jgi:HNH/ENDO VII superfamily nuclease with conserved GHE residues